MGRPPAAPESAASLPSLPVASVGLGTLIATAGVIVCQAHRIVTWPFLKPHPLRVGRVGRRTVRNAGCYSTAFMNNVYAVAAVIVRMHDTIFLLYLNSNRVESAVASLPTRPVAEDASRF
jgi:hypothetical protein